MPTEFRQQWNATAYAQTGGFVPALGTPLLDLLHPEPGERVLDLGCGTGSLTAQLAATGAEVIGLDASPDMVDAARGAGLTAHVWDGQRLAQAFAPDGPLAGQQGRFDAVFSNAALHWMADDPQAVLDGVGSALRPSGRFVAELGGHGNIAAVATALSAVLGQRFRSPWYYPSPSEYVARLRSAGLQPETVELFPRPVTLPSLADWLTTFANGILAALPDADRPAAVAEVERLLRPWLCDETGTWTIDYVRLRVQAVKPPPGPPAAVEPPSDR